jgi:uncharacterized membrane protein SpoIIM required for sporulation
MTSDQEESAGNLEERTARLLGGMHERSAFTRYPVLFAEAMALTWVAFGVPLLFKVSGEELGIFSLFLAAICLRFRFAALLEEHRVSIVERGMSARRAHTVAALSLVALFLGMCMAYLTFIATLETSEVRRVFSFAIERTGLDSGTLLQGRFADVSIILKRNFGAMAAMIVLCVLFRTYGAVLVLGWNAAVWVVTLAMLTRRTVEGLPLHPLKTQLVAGFAIIPHLSIELTAYVIASLAGIFVSKAFTRYEWDDPTFFTILRSSGLLLVAGAVVLVIAAGFETYFTRFALQFLR